MGTGRRNKQRQPTGPKPDRLRAAPLDQRRPAISQLGQLSLAIVAVCVAVTATHWPVLSAQALSTDDPQYLVRNPLVQSPSWKSAGRFMAEVLQPSTVRGYYQPLAMISLMLDYALGGRPDDLRQFHRTSLSLHVANTALIVVFLYLLFGRVWAAAAAGLVFGVHPITVEPLAWVADRKTLLASFFVLACLVIYVRYARRPRSALLAVCAALFVLALLSKPTSTPLPLLLLLLDYWPLRRLSWRTVFEKIPLLLIAGVSAVITVVSQAQAAGLHPSVARGPLQVPLTLCHNVVFYLYKLVWPVEMSAPYPFPTQPLSLAAPMVTIGVLGTIVLLAALLIAWRWTRAPLVSWLFFFVAILPTMGVIGFTYVIAADKFAYLPTVGLLMLLAAFLVWAWNAASHAGRRRTCRIAALTLVVLLGGLEARATRRHLACWHDTERLHRYMLTVTPGAYSARYNLALFLAEDGRVQESIRELEQLLAQHPEPWTVHKTLARTLNQAGRHDDAIAHYYEAARLKPDDFETHYDLGVVCFEQGQTEQAIKHYNEALRLSPDDFRVHVNLGNALFAQGQLERALSCYDQALRLKPRYARGHYNRGLALTQLGRTDEAVAAFRQALQIDPDHAPARQRLEALLLQRAEQREP